MIAVPRDPGCVGSSTREGATRAPHVSISTLRWGFCWNDARTMNTMHSRPYREEANANALPHWPAPVSVGSRVIPPVLWS